MLLAKGALDGIGHGVHTHTPNAYVGFRDTLVEFLLKVLLDILCALRHLINIADAPFSDEGL
jgi:hypothetical protein